MRFLRLSNSGRLLSEPVFTLGSGGRFFANMPMTAAAHSPISKKLNCQLECCPITRPSGMPATIAMTVPVLSSPKA